METATVFLSAIGVVVGILLLIYGSFKRINMFLISVVAVIVISAFSGLNLNDAFTSVYSSTLGSFLASWLLIICLGGVMGSLYEKSGAIWRICDVCMKQVKSPVMALICYAAVAFVMIYGGINIIVVVMILFPFAKELFPKAGVPWYLYPAIASFATVTYAMSMVPGTLQIQNLIPTSYLGTTATAAAGPGIVAAIFCVVLGGLYLRKMIYKGIGTPEADISKYLVDDNSVQDQHFEDIAPNFVICIIPIVVTVIVVNILKAPLVIGMCIGVFASLLLFWKSVKNNVWTIMGNGIMSGVNPSLIISAVAAVGTVISKTPAFDAVYQWVAAIDLPPIWKIIVVTMTTTGMNASGTAGITMTLNLFAEDFLTWGLSPEIIHRVMAICGGTLDSLPWNGLIVMLLTTSGVDLKKGYPHVAAMTVALPLICLIPCVIAYYLL